MKRAVVWTVLTLISSMVYFSCGSGIYDVLSRDQRDPDNFTVTVDSFSAENAIRCSWEKDERCDTYVLMRSEDKSVLRFEEAYRGDAVEYEDKVLKEDTRYLYRLDKIRGTKRFKGGVHYLGLYNKQVKDVYEPNDQKEQAVLLENDKQGNIYYYRSHEGSIVEDEDWYKVRLPARRQAKITIVYDALHQPFIVTKPYNSSIERPATNVPVVIRNDTDYETELRFKISLDNNIVVSGSAGGAYYPYTLRLLLIE